MQLTKEEEKVLLDGSYLIHKRQITQKLERELSLLGKDLADTFSALPAEHYIKAYLGPAAKVSRGENYRGLPYLVLDYPRYFTKEEIFAFRSMVYWAGFYSFTLHLSGSLLEKVKESLNAGRFARGNKKICINNNPWEYLDAKDNYLAINKLTKQELAEHTAGKNFIKVTEFYPLQEYPQLRERGNNFYSEIIQLPG